MAQKQYETGIKIASSIGDTDIIVIDNGGGVNAGAKGSTLRNLVVSSTVPGTSGASGATGQVAYASGFIYVCVAANTWQRVAIASW
jgi:hypothetical protein